MRLTTRLRPFTDTELIEDRITDEQRAEWERQIREARLELARRQPAWEEIPRTRLVKRGRWLVDADTDALYSIRRGVVFEPQRATIGYVPDGARLAYYVDERGDIVFLEQTAGTTWSDVVARQARRR